jgi:hypothetical protein
LVYMPRQNKIRLQTRLFWSQILVEGLDLSLGGQFFTSYVIKIHKIEFQDTEVIFLGNFTLEWS